jgi:hypothetical protein
VKQMKADETIKTFVGLVGIDHEIPNTPSVSPGDIKLQSIWQAFLSFARIPLECQSQIFSFEFYYNDDEKCLYITFRRNFYIPFEEEPDALIPLCFEAGTIYRMLRPIPYEPIFLLVEVETDLDQAVEKYFKGVENYRSYWGPFLEVAPVDAFVFQ